MYCGIDNNFYGALTAFVFVPIAEIKIRSNEEILLKEVMVEGMLSIQAGENPRIIEEKLKAFLSPKLRSSLENKIPEQEFGEGKYV